MTGPRRRSSDAPPEVLARRAKVRVLVAEDNPINQKVASRILDNARFVHEVVSNGLEAVEACKDGAFDIVLMDCQMPELDGFEATRRIRELEREGLPKATIVAMTANARTEDREECLAAGMDDYLSKPVDARRLYAMLDQWIERREAQVVPSGPLEG